MKNLFKSLSVLVFSIGAHAVHAQKETPITLHWEKNMLTVTHRELPDRPLIVNYLEAYCRPGSTDQDWKKTVIPHKTKLIEATPHHIRLECRLEDGVVVTHDIKADARGVTMNVVAHNQSDKESQVHWAQPCVRVHKFTGHKLEHSTETYLDKSFVFINDKLTRLPTKPWAKKARYVPGQVWRPKHVPPEDVNPRPVSPLKTSNGLIGCFSEDDKWIYASAWEPYQELFQGVICCLHSDFRIGGLKPDEKKNIRGRIYLIPNSTDKLLELYKKEFPEHRE